MALPAAPPCGSRKSRVTWRSLTVPKLLAYLSRPNFLSLGKWSSCDEPPNAGLLPVSPSTVGPRSAPSGHLQRLCSSSLSPFPSLLSLLQKLLSLFWLADGTLSSSEIFNALCFSYFSFCLKWSLDKAEVHGMF